MKQPKPVVFVDTEEERTAMMEDFRARKAKARRESFLWSAVALALYVAQFVWGQQARTPRVWLLGELLLVLATSAAVSKLAESKSLSRWWGLLGIPPIFGTYYLLFTSGFAACLLMLMPIPPETPSIRLRSESKAWQT